MSKTKIELLKLASMFSLTSIPDRDFKWYYDAAFNHSLTVEEMDVYDIIFNHITDDKCRDDIPTTHGLKAVDKYLDEHGMHNEEAEYMCDLARLDAWIVYVLNRDDIT